MSGHIAIIAIAVYLVLSCLGVLLLARPGWANDKSQAGDVEGVDVGVPHLRESQRERPWVDLNEGIK